MTRKMMKIFSLMMACMMVLLVSAVSYAEEAPVVDIFATEAPVEELAQEGEAPAEEAAPAEEPEPVEEPAEEPAPVEEPEPVAEPTPAEDSDEEIVEVEADDDGLVEIEDDWGYVSRELIEQHTPEMTQEFIHADDPDWVPEGEEKTEDKEPVQGNEPETTEDVTDKEEETPAEVTEETEGTEAAEEAEASEEAEETEDTEETVSKVVVKVTASMRSENLMHLKAKIEDPEGREFGYQWQVSVDGGENYEDVEDAEEDFLDVELDEENVMNLWRVKVHAVG
jgi:hypothetical protein